MSKCALLLLPISDIQWDTMLCKKKPMKWGDKNANLDHVMFELERNYHVLFITYILSDFMSQKFIINNEN